jgi:hypothetical protein
LFDPSIHYLDGVMPESPWSWCWISSVLIELTLFSSDESEAERGRILKIPSMPQKIVTYWVK